MLTYTDSDTDHEETPSDSPEDINPQSAKIAVLVALQANSLQDLGVKTHLEPVAKKLGVRYRSLGKRDMLLPIARVLFQQGFLRASCSEVDFKVFVSLFLIFLLQVQQAHLIWVLKALKSRNTE